MNLTAQTPTVPPPAPPAGWNDWSSVRFVAPENQKMVGRIFNKQMPKIRAQLSVTWEDLEAETTIDALLDARPLPDGVQHIGGAHVAGAHPAFRRVYRFSDPINGWLIQQAQTFVLDGKKLYTITLTSDPLHFDAAETEMKKSKKTLTV
jgi:hypothetical protein